MAREEIYDLAVRIGIDGTEEAKSKLTAMEKMTKLTEKNLKALNSLNVSPSVKITDKANNTLDKIKAKSAALNDARINPAVKITDSASTRISEIMSNLKRLDASKYSATIRVKDEASTAAEQILKKTDKLKDSVPTVKLKESYKSSTDVVTKNNIREQMLDTEASIISVEGKLGTLGAKMSGLNSKVELSKAKNEVIILGDEFQSADMRITNSLDKIEDKTNNSSNAISESMNKASKNVINVGENIEKTGNSISNVGSKMTMGLTLPLVGVGIAAAKVGMDFDSAMSRVKAISGATGNDFTKLKDQAIDLGASTAFSAKEAASGMENLASAGFSTTEIMVSMPGMLDLAASSGEDLASSADIAASTLRGFGLEAGQAGHVADVLAKNAGKTNAAVRDTGEAMKYIAPVANEAGWSLESVTAAIGEMANVGIKGSSSGTTLRSMFSSLAKPSDEAGKAMAAMGFEAYGADKKMKSLSTLITDLDKSTSKMTTQQKENTIATLFGQEAMSGILALIKDGSSGLDDLTNSYKNSDGAAKEMAKTMQDNAKSSIEQMVGSMETAAIKVEESFAPAITELANTVGNLADKFAQLTPEQQMFYTKILMGVAALGPVTKVIGGITSAMGIAIKLGGKFASLFTAGAAAETVLAEGAVGASSGLSGLVAGLVGTGPAGWAVVAAIAAVGITGLAVAHELSQDVVPKVDLFANKVETSASTITDANGNIVNVIQSSTVKISDATKKSVGAYMEMDNKVQKSLLNMKFTNATLTSDMAKDLTTTFSSMGETISNGLDKNLADSISKIQTMFSSTKTLNSTEQTDILAQIQNHYTNQKTTTQNAMSEINSILSAAAQNNGNITSEQYARIAELRTQMTTTAITALSETEKESAVILGRIKDQSTRITAETASDIVKKLEDQRVKTIDSANIEYAERVRIAEAIRSEGGEKATQTADAIITEAQRQRDETINAANDTKTQGIDVLRDAYSELDSNVNTNTGDILDCWGRLLAWWNNTTFGIKQATITYNKQYNKGNPSNFDFSLPSTGNGGNANGDTTSNYTSGLDSSGNGGYDAVTDSMAKNDAKLNYTGTDNATSGINSVAERGMELVLGRKFYNFKGGEKVLNNRQTLDLLKSPNQEVIETPTSKTYSSMNKITNDTESKVFYLSNGEYKNDIKQSKQGKYQVAAPQVSMPGANYSTGEIHVENNFNNDIEIDEFIEQACQTFGIKLKEALTNIKK